MRGSKNPSQPGGPSSRGRRILSICVSRALSLRVLGVADSVTICVYWEFISESAEWLARETQDHSEEHAGRNAEGNVEDHVEENSQEHVGKHAEL